MSDKPTTTAAGPVPFALETEAALLGILLTVAELPNVRAEVAELLQPSDFSPANAILYSAILCQDGGPVDALSLVSFLEATDPQSLRQIGGKDRIYKLASEPAPFVMAGTYARELAQLGQQRRRLRMAEQVSKAILTGNLAQARGLLDTLEKAGQTAKGATWGEMAKLIGPVCWAWRGWLPAGLLTLLAGESGTGKSILALRLAACFLRGDPWPDGSKFDGQIGKVLWAEAEAAWAKSERLRIEGLHFGATVV